MRKLFLCAIIAIMMVSMVACGDKKDAKEDETENVEKQAGKDLDTLDEEESEGESEDESEDETPVADEDESKKIVSTTSNVAVNGEGSKVLVKESIYAGASKMSHYELSIEYANYRTVNVTFDAPLGLSTEVLWENGAVLMICGPKQMSIYGVDFIRYVDLMTGAEGADYSEALDSIKNDEGFYENFATLTDDDLIKMFQMQEASSWVEERDEYLLIMDEAPFLPEAKLGGYAATKWIYGDPFFAVCTYGEPIDTYNDENTLKIFDTIEWDFVE